MVPTLQDALRIAKKRLLGLLPPGARPTNHLEAAQLALSLALSDPDVGRRLNRLIILQRMKNRDGVSKHRRSHHPKYDDVS